MHDSFKTSKDNQTLSTNIICPRLTVARTVLYIHYLAPAAASTLAMLS